MKDDLEHLQNMADWMDSRFTIPGTNIKFGLDAILGVIPGVGDTVTLATTAYLFGKARSYNLPWYLKIKILWNAFIDWLIGLIPLIGDIFDLGWKANQKNVALIREHLEKHPQTAAEAAVEEHVETYTEKKT